MTEVCMIVAANEKGVIGLNNGIPWHIPEDLHFFKNMTKSHAVVMGRKTFESIGRPLPDRQNYVLSRSAFLHPKVKQLNTPIVPQGHSKVFIIGGSEVYDHYKDKINTVYLTRVKKDVAGDTYLPFAIAAPDWYIEKYEDVPTKCGTPISIQTWRRKRTAL